MPSSLGLGRRRAGGSVTEGVAGAGQERPRANLAHSLQGPTRFSCASWCDYCICLFFLSGPDLSISDEPEEIVSRRHCIVRGE